MHQQAPEVLHIEIAGKLPQTSVQRIIHFISNYPLTIISSDHHQGDALFTLNLLMYTDKGADVETTNQFLHLLSEFLDKEKALFSCTRIPSHEALKLGRLQTLEKSDASRHIITLVGTNIPFNLLGTLCKLCSNTSLHLREIKTLSQPQLASPPSTAPTCLQLRFAGDSLETDQLKSTLQTLTDQTALDIIARYQAPLKPHHRLAVFDMDSTLIQTEVIDELARAAGVGEQVSEITELAMQGKLDFNSSFRQRVSLLKGLSESNLQTIANRLPLTPGVKKLMHNLKRLDIKTAIISGGFQFFANHLQSLLGFDYAFANPLDIRDGIVTGEVNSTIIDGAQKATILEQIAKQEGIPLEHVLAVGDGANDLPMLAMAGMGIAFQAKPIVREKAEHSISYCGLDSVLYIMGYGEGELATIGHENY